MKIAIDISQIVYGGGVSDYTFELVSNLLRLDTKNRYVLFAGSLRRKKDVLNIFPQSLVYPIPPTVADIIWNRLHIFPIEKLIGSVDVFHSSDWTQPPSSAFKVTTVHDLIPLKFPGMLHKNIVKTHLRRLEWVKRETDRVIVPSHSTEEDLITFGVDKSKIRVIPEAPMFDRATDRDIEKIKKEYSVSDNYMVAFASGPYKNIERIVRAFEQASAGKSLKLILIGRQSVKVAKESRNVRLTGFIPTEKVRSLISGSRALIFASLYEGFGQPILEGFSCRVPVVTSNISSMPEVAGNAAAIVDPYDINSIVDGIQKVLRGPRHYIDKGVERVKEFSWEKTAKQTLGVYNEAK